jgi:hypothetical protein
VGLSAGLDAVAKRKIPSLCRESYPGFPARSLVSVLIELSRLPSLRGLNLAAVRHTTVQVTKLPL